MVAPALHRLRTRARRRPRATIVLGGVLAVLLALLTAALIVGPGPILARGGFAPADERLVTGLLVTGTAEAPVIYATSSDPRIGSGLSGEDLPLDTNSGIVSRLARRDRAWQREDLVRGLPRSEENHATNGLVLDEAGERLYVAQGGMTNMGAPSARFAFTPEYALSAAILELDLARIDAPYDLPTLDGDGGDPFGGEAGRNQAVLDPDGPVSLFATGFRNPYDLVRTEAGRLYVVDNGPAYYWGGPPSDAGGRCSTEPVEFGRYGPDFLYRAEDGFYAGHPNPTREGECGYERGERALASFGTSTNGLAEYTARNFAGALAGDLLAASIDQRVYRVELDGDGDVTRTTPLFTVPGFPLDVIAQPDGSPFAGTIFVADYVTGGIVVYEPADREAGPHWRRVAPSGVPRQEVSYVRLGDRFYLAGGGTEHEVYDPATDSWSQAAPLPERLDHIQGVALDGRIYYVGGLESFPEPATGVVLIYDPATDSFSRGAPMPRPRGGGGVAVHEGRIYYAGGLHEGEAVPWFDVYDPRADTWTELPDLPRARDHFQAQVVDGRFYAIGGRETDVAAILGENDAFDFAREEWVTGLAPMPTPRAGYASTVVDGEIVVLGGEGTERTFGEVEAYDPRTNRWRALEPMALPRHGIQAVACGGDIYVAAGGTEPYGEAPTAAHTVYVDPEARCPFADAGEAPPPPGAVRFRRAAIDAGLVNPTSIQFGPDARLYAAEQQGSIHALTVHRRLDGSYAVLARERIDAVREIENHDDDGSDAVGWDTLLRFAAAEVGICCEFPEHRPPLAEGPVTRPPDPERGEDVFGLAGCAGCHTFEPAGSVAFSGPPLDHLRGLPEAYVRTGIVAPDSAVVRGYAAGRMPDDYDLSLSDQQLADLVEFLRAPPDDG
ncbi:MAG: nanM 1 [Gaiellaceae bacterium]|nr:nanM 1 [Gaiellaceae bacterium]